MVKDKKQLLRNPDIEPSDDVIAEALGGGYISYVKFIKELDNKDIQPEWRYYNDGKAWLAKGIYKWIGARGGKKETTVFGYRFGTVSSRQPYIFLRKSAQMYLIFRLIMK